MTKNKGYKEPQERRKSSTLQFSQAGISTG